MEADVIPRSEGTFTASSTRTSVCMCVPMCDISILLYCYVTTLTPLYVRHSIHKPKLYTSLNDNRYVDGGVHASDGGRCHPSIRGDIFFFWNVVLYLYVCSYVRHIYSIVMSPH